MDGFERKILVDRWVKEQKLAKIWLIGGFERQILVDGWVQEQKLVDGWVWAENFGRWMGGSAKPQIEHMYPPKYQVPPPGVARK